MLSYRTEMNRPEAEINYEVEELDNNQSITCYCRLCQRLLFVVELKMEWSGVERGDNK